jgi:hypothetical protein
MITISGCTCYIKSELGLVNLIKSDHNNRMIALSAIALNGFHFTYTVVQGWPDFFSHGPFSIILNVLGAANSFQT